MIKIYGHPQTSAGRCYWMLEEVGADYEAVPINMREKQHKTPEYLALNPNGKVPCLVDGNLVLWESMAINHYLSERYAPQLLGSNPVEKAKITQWSYWAIAEYQKPMIDLFIELVFVPEEKRNAETIEKSTERVKVLNTILDQHLGSKSNMVGVDFTLADLHVASVAKLNSMTKIDISDLKHLTNWLNRMLERPAIKKVEAFE